jgi:hypothetical protein
MTVLNVSFLPVELTLSNIDLTAAGRLIRPNLAAMSDYGNKDLTTEYWP